MNDDITIRCVEGLIDEILSIKFFKWEFIGEKRKYFIYSSDIIPDYKLYLYNLKPHDKYTLSHTSCSFRGGLSRAYLQPFDLMLEVEGAEELFFHPDILKHYFKY